MLLSSVEYVEFTRGDVFGESLITERRSVLVDVQASMMVEGRSVCTQSENCEHVQFILTACKLHAEVSTICIWIHIDWSELRHDDENKTASRGFEYEG